MEQQNKEYKMYYQCRLCGTRNPINAVLCENPDCRADLLLYGDQMFEGEEPPVAIDGDIIIEEVQEMTDRAKPAENVQKTRNNEPKRESKINKLDPPMEDPEKKKSKKGL